MSRCGRFVEQQMEINQSGEWTPAVEQTRYRFVIKFIRNLQPSKEVASDRDLPISIIPTCGGEGPAIQILDSRFRLVELDQLGMLPGQKKVAERLIHHRSEVVLVSERNGSGKTLTIKAREECVLTCVRALISCWLP